MNPVIRAYEARVDDVKASERSVVAKIGGMAIDRHRTIIDPRGIDLTTYRSNPICLWEHGRDPARGMMPVGRNQWIKCDGERLLAKTVFRDDDYSRELFRAYQDGDLRGWSVNVLSHEASPPTHEDERSAPGLRSRCDLIYRKTELAEYSAVAIPSHRDALTILASRGIWIPDEARTMTESEEGEPEGGETVKDCPDCGNPMRKGEGGCTCPKKDDARSAPRTERYIDTDGQTWMVREPDGTAVTPFRDATAAEMALRLMESPVVADAFERVLYTAMAEQRAMDMRREEDLIARIELELFGRV